jgi:hypothetical protein
MKFTRHDGLVGKNIFMFESRRFWVQIPLSTYYQNFVKQIEDGKLKVKNKESLFSVCFEGKL